MHATSQGDDGDVDPVGDVTGVLMVRSADLTRNLHHIVVSVETGDVYPPSGAKDKEELEVTEFVREGHEGTES